MTTDDHRRLVDRLRFALKAVQLVGQDEAADLEADETRLFALVGVMILLGEASAQLSDALRKSLPDLPWRQAKDLRNLLVHRYFEINAERLADTVRRRLPSLILDLQSVLNTQVGEP